MTADSTTQTSTSRALTGALWVLQAVTALGFLFSAYAKLSGMPAVLATFDALGTGPWLAYVIGVLEVLGAVALFVPRLCGLAAAAFVALTVGALLTHLAVGGDPTLAIALLVLSAVIAVSRRRSTVLLVRSLVR